jgi:hypothetical protein
VRRIILVIPRCECRCDNQIRYVVPACAGTTSVVVVRSSLPQSRSSYAGLTRVSILLQKSLTKVMDGRVKPGHDEKNIRFSDRSSDPSKNLRVGSPHAREEMHGTPLLSETRLWNGGRRNRACCSCECCTPAAGRGGSEAGAAARGSRGARCRRAGRGRSAQARTGSLGPPPLAPALAQALASSLGLAPPSLASPLAPPSLVRRGSALPGTRLCVTQLPHRC